MNLQNSGAEIFDKSIHSNYSFSRNLDEKINKSQTINDVSRFHNESLNSKANPSNTVLETSRMISNKVSKSNGSLSNLTEVTPIYSKNPNSFINKPLVSVENSILDKNFDNKLSNNSPSIEPSPSGITRIHINHFDLNNLVGEKIKEMNKLNSVYLNEQNDKNSKILIDTKIEQNQNEIKTPWKFYVNKEICQSISLKKNSNTHDQSTSPIVILNPKSDCNKNQYLGEQTVDSKIDACTQMESILPRNETNFESDLKKSEILITKELDSQKSTIQDKHDTKNSNLGKSKLIVVNLTPKQTNQFDTFESQTKSKDLSGISNPSYIFDTQLEDQTLGESLINKNLISENQNRSNLKNAETPVLTSLSKSKISMNTKSIDKLNTIDEEENNFNLSDEKSLKDEDKILNLKSSSYYDNIIKNKEAFENKNSKNNYENKNNKNDEKEKFDYNHEHKIHSLLINEPKEQNHSILNQSQLNEMSFKKSEMFKEKFDYNHEHKIHSLLINEPKEKNHSILNQSQLNEMSFEKSDILKFKDQAIQFPTPSLSKNSNPSHLPRLNFSYQFNPIEEFTKENEKLNEENSNDEFPEGTEISPKQQIFKGQLNQLIHTRNYKLNTIDESEEQNFQNQGSNKIENFYNGNKIWKAATAMTNLTFESDDTDLKRNTILNEKINFQESNLETNALTVSPYPYVKKKKNLQVKIKLPDGTITEITRERKSRKIQNCFLISFLSIIFFISIGVLIYFFAWDFISRNIFSKLEKN